VIDRQAGFVAALAGLPAQVSARISWTSDWEKDGPYAGALIEGDRARVLDTNQRLARVPGPLFIVQSATTEEIESNTEAYSLDWLLEEASTSVNTAAAGGNASLMTIG
jgi:RHH-type proline utilization regulon transcriptional repressor/proline dehydrogenase/delta 1-pyrroline-5-carboxylate dehydrogenase